MNLLSRLDNAELLANAHAALLQGVLEGLIDGVIILTLEGEWVYCNDYARRLCQQLNYGQLQLDAVPVEIWEACTALIDNHNSASDELTVIESGINHGKFTRLRLRVRWLVLDNGKRPYVMVMLEDCYQSLQNQAIAEVRKYSLTPRQAEVWVLHRTGYSYREISTTLYISLDTVKKHLKDIHAKQRQQ